MEKRKIILDSDPGIDDAAAISIALNSPKLDVKLISTVAGNVTVDKTTNNALKIVDFFNKGKDVRVAAGAQRPLIKKYHDASDIHGESGMPGYDFPKPVSKPLKENSVEAMYKTIMNNEGKITIVATGSYTNIALLLATYPEVKSKIDEIVAMGGSLGKGNITTAAEFNVFTDPDAAEIMYNSNVPIVMIGLDVTNKAKLTPASLNKLKTLGKPGKMLESVVSQTGDKDSGGVAMHDVNTIFYLLYPKFFNIKPMWIDIQRNGAAIGETIGDLNGIKYHNGKTNAKVAVDIDPKEFNKWFLEEVKKISS